jgi:hypothetical protein
MQWVMPGLGVQVKDLYKPTAWPHNQIDGDANFDYLIDRVRTAPLRQDPFTHLYIEDLLRPEHLGAVAAAPDIHISPQINDRALLEELEATGYRAIDFPGCITDGAAYRQWRRGGGTAGVDADSFSGEFGMVFRLMEPQTTVVRELLATLSSDRFLAALSDRFDVTARDCAHDGGIQKYLDGYQISPHPDIRRKALTWMANINPGPNAAEQAFHTRYMRLKPAFAYIQSFWEGNPEVDRGHLPWHVAETVWEHRANNSMVVFAPGDKTLHAVRAWYDHLSSQRTQIYGNLWYRNRAIDLNADWDALRIVATQPGYATPLRAQAAAHAPAWVRAAVRRILPGGRRIHRRTIR